MVKPLLFKAIMDNQNTSTRQTQILSAEAAEGHLGSENEWRNNLVHKPEWDHVEDVKTALTEKILFLRLKRFNQFLVLVKKDD